MPNEISKNTAYVIGGVGHGAAGITDQKGYIAITPGGSASVPKAGTYVIEATGGSAAAVSSASASVVLSNPSSITNSMTYVLASSALREFSVIHALSYAALYSFYPPYEDVATTLPFTDQRFPTCVSFGSSGGPGFKTGVFEVDSGLTATEIEWERIRSRYEVNFDHVPPSDIEAVEEFFYGAKGMAIGFRYKDWSDFTISNQNFMVGDGVTRQFQLFKRYISGSNFFDPIIRKPIASTFIVVVDGQQLIINQDYWVNESDGVITFKTPPASQALGTIVQAEFDVPVRFDDDFLNVSYDDFQQLNISGLPLIEVLT